MAKGYASLQGYIAVLPLLLMKVGKWVDDICRAERRDIKVWSIAASANMNIKTKAMQDFCKICHCMVAKRLHCIFTSWPHAKRAAGWS